MTGPITTALTITPLAKACHNCRRNRSRCRRSLPQCHNCSSQGDQCLGYGKLLRWTNAVVVRGDFAEQVGQRLSSLETFSSDNGTSCTRRISYESRKPSFRVLMYTVMLVLSTLCSRTLALDIGHTIATVSHKSYLITTHPPCMYTCVLTDAHPVKAHLSRSPSSPDKHEALFPKSPTYLGSLPRPCLFRQQKHTNPFHSAITLLGTFDYLREVSGPHGHSAPVSQGHPYQKELIDALTAKDQAYRLLRRALDHLKDASPEPHLLQRNSIFHRL